MNYNGRLYPHPVLGVDDNYKDTYRIDLNVSSDSRKIKLDLTYILENDELLNLIFKGSAEFCAQLYCRSTMFRQSFMCRKQKHIIEIESYKLRDSVEVDFFICASDEILNYSNTKFNSIYSKTSFDIEKGDLLAYGGSTTFFANKSPQELKNLSSFMSINTDNKSNEPIKNDYDGDKITIILSQEDYDMYQIIKKERLFTSTLHGSVVLPALAEVIRFMKTPEGQDYKENKWFLLLSKLLESYQTAEPLQTAQKILDLPVNRSFKSLFDILN